MASASVPAASLNNRPSLNKSLSLYHSPTLKNRPPLHNRPSLDNSPSLLVSRCAVNGGLVRRCAFQPIRVKGTGIRRGGAAPITARGVPAVHRRALLHSHCMGPPQSWRVGRSGGLGMAEITTKSPVVVCTGGGNHRVWVYPRTQELHCPGKAGMKPVYELGEGGRRGGAGMKPVSSHFEPRCSFGVGKRSHLEALHNLGVGKGSGGKHRMYRAQARVGASKDEEMVQGENNSSSLVQGEVVATEEKLPFSVQLVQALSSLSVNRQAGGNGGGGQGRGRVQFWKAPGKHEMGFESDSDVPEDGGGSVRDGSHREEQGEGGRHGGEGRAGEGVRERVGEEGREGVGDGGGQVKRAVPVELSSGDAEGSLLAEQDKEWDIWKVQEKEERETPTEPNRAISNTEGNRFHLHLPSVHRIPSVTDISASTRVFVSASNRALRQSVKGAGPYLHLQEWGRHMQKQREREDTGGVPTEGEEEYQQEDGEEEEEEEEEEEGGNCLERVGLDLDWRYKEDNPFLQGNFAPVSEETETPIPCQVIGRIPSDLRGKFLRNGPNPQFTPLNESAYHWFDGDGMIHCVEFSEEGVWYSNRYVHTTGWQEEHAAGHPLHPGMNTLGTGIGSEQIRVALLNFLQLRQQDGPFWNLAKNSSNNHLVYHAGQLLSLYEAGLPYLLDPDTLSTKGVYEFGGKWRHGVTAHPKKDPITGELMLYGYNLTHQPFLQYGVVSPSGEVIHTCDICLPRAVLMHDFAITPHFTIFLDFPVEFQIEQLIETRGKAKPFSFQPNKAARIGVMPRFGTQEDIMWFHVSPGFCLHTLNAHEEEEYLGEMTVVLRAFRFDAFSGLGMADIPPQLQSFEVGRLHEYRLNLFDGISTERCISPVCSDFPAIHPGYTGHPITSAFSARFAAQPGPGSGLPVFDAIIKHNLTTGKVEAFDFGKDRIPGEPIFVPKKKIHPQEQTPANTPKEGKEDASAAPGVPEAFSWKQLKRQLNACGGSSAQAQSIWLNALQRHNTVSSSSSSSPPSSISPSSSPSSSAGGPLVYPRQAPKGQGQNVKGSGKSARGTVSLSYGPGVKDSMDDVGYILVHVWDERQQQSEMWVLDAKKWPPRAPLARVILPKRVPFGFHGTFIPKDVL